jgi:membrane protein implicated in regulation of membrane protease activity
MDVGIRAAKATMDFSASSLWWMAAGVAVAIELLTGTFYLLMMALGLAAAAVSAHAGWASTAQIITAALVGGGATALWHFKRASHPQSKPVRENRDANLDIGERVMVDAWTADGTARVTYRGSVWTARLRAGAASHPGAHTVCAVEGNWLELAPATAPAPSPSAPH